MYIVEPDYAVMKTTFALMLLAVIIASVMCRRISPIRSDKGEHIFLGLLSNPQFKHKCGIVPLTSSKQNGDFD